MNKYLLFLIIALTMLSSGCTMTKYKWNHYDSTLYQHYKNPSEKESFIENLMSIIQEGEPTNSVPPGIYAEYGYVLYENGRYTESVNYFQKEYDKWPESRVIMSKMIANAGKQNDIQKQKTALEKPAN